MQPPYQQPQYPNTSHDPTIYPRPLEPTQAVYYSRPYETTEPVSHPLPYLYNPYDVPPIPPPPPKSKADWKHRSVLLICALSLITSAVLGYLYVNTTTKPVVQVPAKLVTVVVTPTHQAQAIPTQQVQAIPTYESGLSSTNFNLFVNAFADALAEQDVQNIEDNTDVKGFILDCSPAITLIPGENCESQWKIVHKELAADKLEFGIPPDATLNTAPLPSTCKSAPNNGYTPVLGSYDNKDNLPVAHYGNAVFVFTCVTCGSETTWAWHSVYLC